MAMYCRNVKKAKAKKKGLEKVIGFSQKSIVILERVLVEGFEEKYLTEAKEKVCCEGSQNHR